MALGSGMAGSVGIGAENTWGSAVVPTRWLPHVEDGLKRENDRIESKGIIAGRRVLDRDQSAVGNDKVGGKWSMEMYDHAQGLHWKSMLGGATITSTAGAAPYTQTFTPSDLPSFTYQAGRPDVGGTVRVFTYGGCKVDKWQLGCQVGEIAMLDLDVVAKNENLSSTLTTVTYTSATYPVTYINGSVTIAGSSIPIKQLTLSGDNKLASDRRFLGSGTVAEQLEADLREYTGSFQGEFRNLTDYQNFTTFSTTCAVVLTFAAGPSAANTTTITMNARFDGETPTAKGRGILDQPLKFKCVGSTDAAAITVVTVNSDSAY